MSVDIQLGCNNLYEEILLKRVYVVPTLRAVLLFSMPDDMYILLQIYGLLDLVHG